MKKCTELLLYYFNAIESVKKKNHSKTEIQKKLNIFFRYPVKDIRYLFATITTIYYDFYNSNDLICQNKI